MISHRTKVASCLAVSLVVQLGLVAVGNHDLPQHVAPYLEYLRNAMAGMGLYYLTPPADPAGNGAGGSGVSAVVDDSPAPPAAAPAEHV